MRLRNDEATWNKLREVISDHYDKQGRPLTFFSPDFSAEDSVEVAFLIDRKHVAKYLIGVDRGIFTGALLLAIGPHYFRPSQFWSYEDSKRFSIDATTEAVEHNLSLLDEFLASNQN